jgi:hypothetical protein
MRIGLKRAGLLGLHAHALHSRHHVSLLRQERVAERRGPIQTLIHHLEHSGKSH